MESRSYHKLPRYAWRRRHTCRINQSLLVGSAQIRLQRTAYSKKQQRGVQVEGEAALQ